MLRKQIRRTLSTTLAVCCISAFYALPTLAMPQVEDQDQLKPQKTKQSTYRRPQTPSATDSHSKSPSGPMAQRKPSGQIQQSSKAMPRDPVGFHRPDNNRPDFHRPDSYRPYNVHHTFAPGPRYQNHRSYPYWRRSDIVFRFGGPSDYFWWGSSHGISLGEYLILTMIVQSRPTLTIDQVFNLHQNGYSYETICYDNGLIWYDINYGARSRYRTMHRYSIEQDVSFWGWDDTLGC